MSRQMPDMRPQGQNPLKKSPSGQEQTWRWVVGVTVAVLFIVFLSLNFFKSTPSTELTYSTFLQDSASKQVSVALIDNTSGKITGQFKDGTTFFVNGPSPSIPTDLSTLRTEGVTVEFQSNQGNVLATLITWLGPLILLVVFFAFINRRAQGQMSGIMSIGRSRAKVYTSERPKTTFDDVAGYTAVKQEITEVVDFLKNANRFKEIGARVPKGILLVGPPGTGKTLLARAVAGEAGVPFLSVTGSDFMEMFVGVGASRVRDLFQTARKQAPAIIFVDEIDSIGRKRGAGLGGGHDEREQTLNQMLSEMDGFETTEGIVMMAATNRPDILDSALLRPGRFDRQIVVPLPDLAERIPILKVHCKGKRTADDVNLETVARGTPGMSGADLANLVNEAALHAVRRGDSAIHMEDFEAARDRVLMGQRRDSVVLSEAEKERVAFHEGGHAVLAYLLPYADPVHKVTILPTGMALGVTQQLPLEERHINSKEYIEESLVVRMGGRVAELIIYGDLSTGANNDLVRNTELARKMVREWGMSDQIGPMAWGNQDMVFLGDDLMHTRDYSEQTSRIIDEEVEKILRVQEERAMILLSKHRHGLELVAKALLERETIDGSEVGRLVNEGNGGPVHDDDAGKFVPRISYTPLRSTPEDQNGDTDTLEQHPNGSSDVTVQQPTGSEG